jgi:hypothetical protein
LFVITDIVVIFDKKTEEYKKYRNSKKNKTSKLNPQQFNDGSGQNYAQL